MILPASEGLASLALGYLNVAPLGLCSAAGYFEMIAEIYFQ